MAVKNNVSVILFILCVSMVTGSTLWSETVAEYRKLHDAYKQPTGNQEYFSDILPRSDDSAPVDVFIGIEMYAMREFDAVDGALDIVGSVLMTWIDPIETLSTGTTFDTTKVKSLLVNYKKIWTPVVVLLNSADSIERVGDDAYPVRINLTSGVVTWKPRVLMRSSCAPDVKFFPFDQQTCDFVFMPWSHNSSKVRLETSSNSWTFPNYKDSGIWKKDDTSSEISLIDGYYHAKFTIRFSRQPLFFMINIVFPILLLSVLSGFLFLLPAASGERVGFGITCFLSFVVLLQTTIQYLPEISDPMSLLCVYAIIMMVFSGTLSIVNILLLRVYHKTNADSMPKFLVHLLEIIRCVKCKRKGGSGSEGDKNDSTTERKDGTRSTGETSGNNTNAAVKEMDWTAVGKFLDFFFLILFFGAQIGFTVVFLAPIMTSA